MQSSLISLYMNKNFINMEKDKELIRVSRTADQLGKVDVTKLSEAEKTRCREITRSVKDIETLNTFGSDIANARNEATHQLLEINKIDKAGQVGDLVRDVVDAIRDTEYKDIDSMKGWRGFVAKYIPFGTSIVKRSDKYILDRFSSAKDIVDKVVEGLRQQQVDLKTDSNTLECMLQKTKSYVDQLGIHYVALYQLYQDQSDELARMIEENKLNPGTYSDYQIAEKRAFLEEIENRAYDLFVSGQYNANVLIPSIIKMKDNAVRLARNAEQIVATTIPNWEMSISMALVNQRAKTMADVQKTVKDKNNELMVANAKMIRDVTVTLERESRRGTIDIEAYKEAYETVTEALVESTKSLREAKVEREKNMEEIAKINREMSEKFKAIGEETRRFYLDGDTIQTAAALK